MALTQVTKSGITADAIDATKIADNAVDSEHIAADSIDAEHYAAGSVDATALGADAVTAAKIGDDFCFRRDMINQLRRIEHMARPERILASWTNQIDFRLPALENFRVIDQPRQCFT